MKTTSILPVMLATATLGTWLSPAYADSAEAMCEVRKDGDTKKGASGPCTFSQRQGYVDIDLRNGDKYSLRPGNKDGHYKDLKGNTVKRTSSGGTEEFKWEGGKKITVTYVSSGGGNSHHENHAAYTAGATAPDLADLVGARAGQAEGEFGRRGYKYASGSTSGHSKYSNYWNSSTGRCVTVRTEEGRYQSIVQAPPFDCGR